MNGGFNDDFDKRLKDTARQYNEPPETPRDAMWARVLAGRAERRVTRMPAPVPFWRSRRLWIPVAAAAAVMVIGVAIGRFTAPVDVGPGDKVAGGPGTNSSVPKQYDVIDRSEPQSGRSAYELAAVPIFNQAEVLLTEFRTGEEPGDNGDSFSRRAGSLLMDTRLLLDSPAADDPKLYRLLSDLELVLIQIVRMTTEDEQVEKELINDNMSNRSLLPRLRANSPTGTFTSTI